MSTISKAKNGDEEAFSELINQYKLEIYKTSKAILKNEDDVCDAIQETLISVYKNISSLKNEKYFKTWLIRITINKCYDIIGKNSSNKKKIILLEKETYNDDNLDLKTELERALNLIDNDLKLVTVLFYYDDISVKDIAGILGIPVGTVKSKLSRAREQLYNILKQEEVNTKDE